MVRTSWSGEQFKLEAGDEPLTPLEAWLTEEASTRLVALGGHDLAALVERARSREFRPVPLGVTTSTSFSVALRETETANVAGVLHGSDDTVADQMVLFSAHHDHLGLGEPDESGDRIYNGALDNGVAMAQVLDIAAAFAGLGEAPRRSVMVLFPAAEEQGLLGSKYFANSGAVHPGNMVADINLELGNVWGRTRDVVIFGQGQEHAGGSPRSCGAPPGAHRDPRGGSARRLVLPVGSVQPGSGRRALDLGSARAPTSSGGRPARVTRSSPGGFATVTTSRATEVSEDWNLEGLAEDARLAFYLGAAVTDT